MLQINDPPASGLLRTCHCEGLDLEGSSGLEGGGVKGRGHLGGSNISWALVLDPLWPSGGE